MWAAYLASVLIRRIKRGEIKGFFSQEGTKIHIEREGEREREREMTSVCAAGFVMSVWSLLICI